MIDCNNARWTPENKQDTFTCTAHWQQKEGSKNTASIANCYYFCIADPGLLKISSFHNITEINALCNCSLYSQTCQQAHHIQINIQLYKYLCCFSFNQSRHVPYVAARLTAYHSTELCTAVHIKLSSPRCSNTYCINYKQTRQTLFFVTHS